MANSFASNFTRKLAKIILKQFESNRVLSKNVDTQLLNGRFGPDTGENVDFKRPTDYVSIRTSDGDLSSASTSDIITGKATGTVQDYITVWVNFDEADQAIKMDQQKQLVEMPMAKRIVTDLEVDFAKFMMKNAGLLAGTYGTAADAWDDVAEAGAIMQATGVPMDSDWCYAMNPFTQRKLASNQRSLGAGGTAGGMISEAHRKAILTENFAGMKVLTATTLGTVTSGAGADRAGVLASNPDVTYATHKDTMVQSLAVSGMTANLPIKAGQVVTIAGRYRLNLNTREPMVDESGNKVVYSGVVTEDVTLSGTGTGTIKVSGPAIYEATGAYNTVDSAPVATDVVTVLGAASTLYQPNLFWHKQAYSIGSVPLRKLYAHDTIFTTEDGLQMRVSYGSDITKNLQKIRIDLRPAYAVFNPFFAGQGFGS